MKRYFATRSVRPWALVSIVLLVVWTGHVLARSDGITGRAQNATGCSCHSSTPNASGAATTTITGPSTVAPNETANYTVTVSGGPSSSTGGFNLEADSGTLVAGANNQLLSGQLTHISESSRSWSFSWTAPATEGTANFYAIAQATNGTGTGGDSWNWYGNAAGTPFVIQVAGPTSVDTPAVRALWLSSALPNPFVGTTQIRFSLAKSGPTKLSVFDAAGRRVATLLSGELSAGPHEATWTGHRMDGALVESGMYVIELESGGERLTTKAIKTTR